MPQLDTLQDNITLPIDFKAFGIKIKMLSGSTMMVLYCSSQKSSKDTKDLCAMNSEMQQPTSHVLQKKKLFAVASY